MQSVQRRPFLAGLLALGLLPRAAEAETRLVNSPGDGFLNLRSGPGSTYQIIRRMDHGSRVEVIEAGPGGWVWVRHESGATGWAFAQYLVRPSSNWLRVYSPNDGYLTLRTGPDTDYPVLRRMYNFETVEVLETRGSWARVRHESGDTGWAHRNWLVN